MSARRRWEMMEAAVYAAAYVSRGMPSGSGIGARVVRIGDGPWQEVVSADVAHSLASMHVAEWREATREQREREIREDADQA
jgi:hypothetical protein